jgi:hypothetical protein
MKRTRPVGDSAIYKVKQVVSNSKPKTNPTHLAARQNIVQAQTAEQRPHLEIDIDESFSKVEATRHATDHLERRKRGRNSLAVPILLFVLFTGGIGTGVQLDEFTGFRDRCGENLGDLPK